MPRKKPAIDWSEHGFPAPSSTARSDAAAYAQTAERAKSSVRAMRGDGWKNLYMGAGVAGRDKLESTTFDQRGKLQPQSASDLYRQNWIAKRIVDDLCGDATRAGWTVELSEDATDDNTTDLVQAEWERLRVMDRLAEGLRWALVFGGAVGLLYTEDEEAEILAQKGASGTSILTVLAEPLNPANLRAIRQITIVDLRFATPDLSSYTTQLDSMNFGNPEFYAVTPFGQSTNTTSFRVHWTRLLRFDGVPTDRLTRLANQTWGDSIYEAAWDPLMRYGMAYQGAAVAANEFALKTLGIDGLSNLLETDQYAAIQSRMSGIKLGLGAYQMALLDKEGEELKLMSQPVTGLDDLLDRFKQEVAGAARIPQSRLWGNQIGKVAGAEEDGELWAQYVHAWQSLALEGPLRYLTELLFAAKEGPFGGNTPKSWSVKPNPIDAPSLEQQLALQKQQADIDAIYIDRAVLERSEVREARWGGAAYNHEMTLDQTISAAIKASDIAAAKAQPAPPEKQTPPDNGEPPDGADTESP